MIGKVPAFLPYDSERSGICHPAAAQPHQAGRCWLTADSSPLLNPIPAATMKVRLPLDARAHRGRQLSPINLESVTKGIFHASQW